MKRLVDPSQEPITWVTPNCKSSKEYRMKLGKTPMNDSVNLTPSPIKEMRFSAAPALTQELNRMYDNDNVSKSNKGVGVGAGSPGRGQS